MLRRGAVAVVAGLALWLSFPSMNLWFLAPVGVGLLALATAGARAWQGALLGAVTGVAFFWPLLTWIGIYLGPVPVIALVTLQSLYVALAGWAMAVVQRATVYGRPAGAVAAPLGVALAWTVTEWLRSVTPFGGFGWGRLAFGQADAPWAPVVAYVGAHGLTFLVALIGALLARVVVEVAQPDAREVRSVPVLASAGTAALLVLASGTGGALVRIHPGDEGDIGSVHVLAVQGNVPRPGLDFNAERRLVTDNHARATTEAAGRVERRESPQPDLVVWPENSSDIDPTRNEDAHEVITRAVDRIGAPTVVGAVLREPGDMLSNTAMLYAPGVGEVDRYVKQRPVPFAEYMPYRSFFRAITPMVDLLTRDFAAGDRSVVFDIPRSGPAAAGEPPIRLATPICFEVAIDDVMATPVRQGANLLAIPTNNATFGYTDESVQQLAISRIRAMEFGRAIVHVSTVGVSALITPDGVAHQRTELFTQATLEGELPLREVRTPATGLQLLPALSAPLLLVLLARRLRERG